MKEEYSGHPEFYKILDKMKELHNRKNAQYATSKDPLGNFRRASALVEKLLNPKIKNKKLAYLLVLMSKQVDGVYEMLGESKEDTVEELNDKLMDIAIYAVLAMIIEKEG